MSCLGCVPHFVGSVRVPFAKPPASRIPVSRPVFFFSCSQSGRNRAKMAQVVSSQLSDAAGTQQQKVEITNKHGEKLAGILHETGSKELVILCHGFRSSKEYNTLVNLAAALTREGISVFRFDFAGNGESEGSFQYGNYKREADDLRAVVEYYLERKREITAIVGHSKGGNVVLLYASMHHDVHTVVNLSGRFALERGIEGRLGKGFMEKIKRDGYIDVKDGTGEIHTLMSSTTKAAAENPDTGEVEYRVTEESLMDRLTTDMDAASCSIDKECRTLTVHGSADEIVPVDDASEFARRIPNHRLHIMEGANHGYSSHQNELVSMVVDFIKEGLHQGINTPSLM